MSFHTSDSPKATARLLARIGFGLALTFVGFAHYRDIATYSESVGRGLGPLEGIGFIWGYVLPALMILGGLLLTFGIYVRIAAYAATIALASIPAGLMLKSAIEGISLEQTMPPAMNAFVWLIVLLLTIKGNSCGSCATSCNCGCGCASCACSPDSKTIAVKPSQSTMPSKSVATPMVSKAPAKKAPAKKAPPRKR